MAILDPNTAQTEVVARTIMRLLPSLLRLVVAEMHGAPHTAGMTLPQFRILGRLNERDYRAAELAEVLEVGRPTLTATLDCLERRGLIVRVRDVPGDRRGVTLRLTTAGRALHGALDSRAVAGVAALLTEAKPGERAALALGLAGLERCLERTGRFAQPSGIQAQRH